MLRIPVIVILFTQGDGAMIKTKFLAFIALMAALANILSMPPFAIPIVFGGFEASIHFFQLAIFLAGILAGSYGGLLAGAVGGLFMGVTRIPFIIGGIAILGGSVGFFSKRVRPVFAGIFAWLVQAPYVVVTDYIWFTLFLIFCCNSIGFHPWWFTYQKTFYR